MTQETEESKAVALLFVKEYATQNQFFNGGDVLSAFRMTDKPEAKENWRNRWGVVMSTGARMGWYFKAGTVAPTTTQSHTKELTQWQSRLFKGPQSLSPVTVKTQLDAIRKKMILREIDLMKALWLAYELGSQNKGE